MLSNIKGAWRRLRAHFWASLAFDVALIATVFLAVHAWQTRDLPIDEAAPATMLALLGGGGPQSAIGEGQAGIVYFFAPWCGVCRASIGNLDELVVDGRVAWATVVALDYADEAEVAAFIERTGVTLPVLLGDRGTAVDWSVPGFPTYYVIDAEGRIDSRSVGYSTTIGMWLRAWKAGL